MRTVKSRTWGIWVGLSIAFVGAFVGALPATAAAQAGAPAKAVAPTKAAAAPTKAPAAVAPAVAAPAPVATAPVAPAADLVTLNIADGGGSRVTFVSTAAFETIVGSTSKVSGQLRVRRGNVAQGAEGWVELEAATFRTGIDLRDEHLRSSNWINSAQYPKIRFELSKLTGIARFVNNTEQRGNIEGRLTFHGVTKNVRLPVRVYYHQLTPAERDVPALHGMNPVLVRGTFNVDLAQHGISVPPILRWQVAAQVRLDFDLRATEEPAPAAVAAQPAPALGLGLGHHQGSLGRALGPQFLGQIIGGGQGLEMMDGASEIAGLQPLDDLGGQEFVREPQEPVPPPGGALDAIAQGLETVDALPDRGPAEAQEPGQGLPGEGGGGFLQSPQDDGQDRISILRAPGALFLFRFHGSGDYFSGAGSGRGRSHNWRLRALL